MNSLLRGLAFAFITVALPLHAEGTNTASAEKKPAAEKKDATKTEKKAHAFHGKLAAVDKTAKTITVGKSVYWITPETKIKKADKPATLADSVIGGQVTGYAKPTDDGRMAAASLNLSPKTESKK